MDSQNSLMSLKGVYKIYRSPAGQFEALKGVNLEVSPKEFIVVVGKSGSGKSTLLHLIAGIDRPERGSICVAGTSIHALGERELSSWRGKTIGVVFQFFQLLPTLTIAENLMLAMDFCSVISLRKRRTRTIELLDRFGIQDQANKLPSALSGGQQQRAAIARAIANEPPIILADEPTGNLDAETANDVLALLSELPSSGTTVLMVTHERDTGRFATRTIELKIVFRDSNGSESFIRNKAVVLAEWLTGKGLTVEEIQIPPPLTHPHQSQFVALMSVFLVFGLLVILLNGILMASVVNAMMAREIRSIGIMKAIGGRSGQIAAPYLVLVLAIGILAVSVSLILSITGGKVFSGVLADLLKLRFYDLSVPAWNIVLEVAAGIFVPFILCLIPIVRTSRMSVSRALADTGTGATSFATRTRVFFTRISELLPRGLELSIRNAFRRRARLLLTVSMLAGAGAIFITAVNVRFSWDALLAEARSNRNVDFDIRLERTADRTDILLRIAAVPGVSFAEAWGYTEASRANDSYEITRVYPDGGHGSMSLQGVPRKTRMARFSIMQGRWFDPGLPDGVVLNPNAYALMGKPTIGEMVRIRAWGKVVEFQLIGVVREIGPAAAHMDEYLFSRSVGTIDQVRLFRIKAVDSSVLGGVEKSLNTLFDDMSLPVSLLIPEATLRTAMGEHMFILITCLIAMSILIAIVGLVGLSLAAGVSITERTRELAMMRTMGATPSMIFVNIIIESIVIGFVSLAAGILISLPVTLFLDGMLGTMSFRLRLPFMFSVYGASIWSTLVVLGSIIVVIAAAYRASGLSVREGLAYY